MKNDEVNTIVLMFLLAVFLILSFEFFKRHEAMVKACEAQGSSQDKCRELLH